MNNFQAKIDFIWKLANYLRHDYKPHEYADVILPLVVLRRLDQAMQPTHAAVIAAYEKYHGKLENLDSTLSDAAGTSLIYNHSPWNWSSLLNAPQDLSQNLIAYFNAFSPEVQDIIEKFDFRRQIARLEANNLLYHMLKEFDNVDLHPDVVENHEMGYIFEELIRRFSEQYNETAGEHFTPREVIELMVDLLLSENPELYMPKEKIIEIYDPACGTGGMLTEGKKSILKHNSSARVFLFGQEVNPVSFAIAKADLLLKGEDPRRLKFGNSFTEDGLSSSKFRLMLSNPPFGVEWKKFSDHIKIEHESKGFDGRFGAGLPRITDGSLLFLMHMLSKRMQDEEGSRIAIIFNGSPLFTGDAGSGESEIRRWIIQNDWLEGIVALPDQLFYNTGINTYIWIVTNSKSERRRGKVQLLNAVDLYAPMTPRSLGNKRHLINSEQREQIAAAYQAFQPSEISQIFDNNDFGYRRIRVERPLRLNFQASPERIERLKESSAFAVLAQSKKKIPAEQDAEIVAGLALQEQILTVLKALPPGLLKVPKQYQRLLDKALKPFNLKATLRKTVLDALTERDETAEPVLAKKGGYEPDSELRDYENVPLTTCGVERLGPSVYDENVPLKEDIYTYFEREVQPYVPDAWIDENYCDQQDHEVGVVGYELNFNRYFYKYTPPPDLQELNASIRTVEARIRELMKEMGI